MLEGMTLGLSPPRQEMLITTTSFCGSLVAPDSVYGLLHRECHRLFPDEMFADLFCDIGRRSVPSMIVAVVVVLQRLEGALIVRRSSGSASTRGGSTRRAG